VTVGSTLPTGDPVARAFPCFSTDDCTLIPLSLAAGNAGAPSAGVITSFNVKVKGYAHVRFRVERGSFAQGVDTTNVYRSAERYYTVAGGGVQVFTEPARVPVQVGDRVGADVGPGIWSQVVMGSSEIDGAGGDVFHDGGVHAANLELLVNGILEPDADHDGYGDETQDCQPADPSQHTPCAGGPPPPPAPPPPTPPPPRTPKVDVPHLTNVPVSDGSADVDTHCDVPPGLGIDCSGAHATYAGVGPGALGGVLSTGPTLGWLEGDGLLLGGAAKAKARKKRPLTLKIGSARFHIAAGKHKLVKIPLNRRARAALAKRGTLKALLVTTIKDKRGKLHTTRRTITLRVKKHPKKTHR
jgi:hypothetical protein